MIAIRGFKEVVAFTVTTALSCGPSQLFGLIKMVVDTALLALCKSTQKKLTNHLKAIDENWDHFKKTESLQNIAKKLRLKNVSQEAAREYCESKGKRNQERISKLYRSLRSDRFALIPFAGAHISWRIATNYKGKSFSAIFSRGIAQALEHHQKACSRLLFYGRKKGKNYDIPTNIDEPEIKSEYAHYSIPVETSTKRRYISASFARANLKTLAERQQEFIEGRQPVDPTIEEINQSFSKQPTMVIFHPAVAVSMQKIANFYRLEGYNVLCVTLGGYPNSKGVTTSEASTMQDIEAIKLFLREKGVKDVAYHGWSMGSGMAFQAAVGETSVKDFNTLFVVADRPYNSAAGVGANIAGAIGRGIMSAGFPEGNLVELPGGLWTRTDGLDNMKKARLLKENNIPLVCVYATKDFLMGRKKVRGSYQENFAKDLIKQRYLGEKILSDFHLVKLDGSHFENLCRMYIDSIMYQVKNS